MLGSFVDRQLAAGIGAASGSDAARCSESTHVLSAALLAALSTACLDSLAHAGPARPGHRGFCAQREAACQRDQDQDQARARARTGCLRRRIAMLWSPRMVAVESAYWSPLANEEGSPVRGAEGPTRRLVAAERAPKRCGK